MSARLAILQKSLAKKQAAFDARLAEHFDSARSTNGQPLNDKRDGRKTMAKWDRQNDALRNLRDGIELTKKAIQREEAAIERVATACSSLPEAISRRVAEGILQQWRKHPHTFFVCGVDKARIVLMDDGQVAHRYVRSIADKDQYKTFANTYNAISREIASTPEESSVVGDET